MSSSLLSQPALSPQKVRRTSHTPGGTGKRPPQGENLGIASAAPRAFKKARAGSPSKGDKAKDTGNAAGVTIEDSGSETEPETLYTNDDARSREIGKDTTPHYPCQEQQAVGYKQVQRVDQLVSR
jgi:hypothetical protein